MPRNPVLIIKAPILYTVVSALPVADESIKRSPRTPIAQGQLPKEPPQVVKPCNSPVFAMYKMYCLHHSWRFMGTYKWGYK